MVIATVRRFGHTCRSGELCADQPIQAHPFLGSPCDKCPMDLGRYPYHELAAVLPVSQWLWRRLPVFRISVTQSLTRDWMPEKASS